MENLFCFFAGVFVFAILYVVFLYIETNKPSGKTKPYAGADYYDEKTGLFKPISQRKGDE